jgi:hypothetical protein
MSAPAPALASPNAVQPPVLPAAAPGVRQPVRTLAELLDRQAGEAVAIGGADRSCWNGRIEWLPRPGSDDPPGVVGIADWDGTICLSRKHVLRPLNRLFGAEPAALSTRQLLEAKLAVSVLLHENNHLLVSGGQRHEDTEEAWEWPMVVLEEGVTEAVTHVHLDDYIERLGLDRLAPGLRDVEVPATYPAYVPAVEALARGVGHLTGRPPDEVLRRLNAQSGAAKYPHLGHLVLEGSGLAGRLSASERSASAERIATSARTALSRVGEAALSPDGEDVERHSRRVGRDAVRAIVRDLQALEEAHPPAAVLTPPHLRARNGRREVGRRRQARGSRTVAA